MFSIHNLYNNLNTVVRVEHEGRIAEFNISALISKRSRHNKEDLDDKIQFTVLNSYLEYKGDDFKSKLMDTLVTVQQEVDNLLTVPELHPLPYHIVLPVLDLFDLQDVFYFLKFVFKLTPPPNLADQFDPLIEQDSRGTRVQTYLKDDYLELAALSTILKVGLMGTYNLVYNRQKDLSSTHREYILFHLYRKHPIMESPPMVKVRGWIEKLIEQTSTSDDTESIRTLERQVPKQELSNFILSIIISQKIAIAPLINDSEASNVVTKAYNYINNKLKNSGDISNSYKNKTSGTSEENHSEKESYAENIRVSSSRNDGEIIEMNWAVNSIERIISQLPKKQQQLVDIRQAKEVRTYISNIVATNILESQISIVASIFKSIMDPRCIDYLEIENLFNLFAVAFSYLWNLGHKQLAVVLLSSVDNSLNEDVVYINSTVNKSRIPKELKEELDIIFPYKKVINADTTENLVEKSIGVMSDELLGCKLVPVIPLEMVTQALGSNNTTKLIDSDIKINLADFIIKNERMVY